MIVSHTDSFITTKSWKKGDTCLEGVQSNYCAGDNIVTPLNDCVYNRNETWEFFRRYMSADKLADTGQHVELVSLRNRIQQEVWDSHYKFVIAKNPRDKAISDFFWENNKT